MSRKFDFNGTHVPPPYMDRSFNGAENMISRKSAQEAPDVALYDYNNVGNFECLETMTTNFDMIGVDQNSTSLYGHVGGKDVKPVYDTNVLLNDAWFCVLSDDGGKLYTIMNTLKQQGVPFPADHPFSNMFGTTTLWEKINDMELKLPMKTREDARRLFAMFHT